MGIAEFRNQIDGIDGELARLLKERLDLVSSIGMEKQKQGIPVFDPSREQAILDRLSAAYPDCADEIRAVYQTIFQVSRKRQS